MEKSKATGNKTPFHEITIRMLKEFAAKTQFEQRASRAQGKTERGLQLLEKAKNLMMNDE